MPGGPWGPWHQFLPVRRRLLRGGPFCPSPSQSGTLARYSRVNCQKHKMNKRTLETPSPVLLLELRCKLMYWKQNTPECSFSVCMWSSSHTGQPSLSQLWADGLSPQQCWVSATSRFASLTDRSLASRFDLGRLAASETALLLPVWCVYVCPLHALLTPATRFSSCFW